MSENRRNNENAPPRAGRPTTQRDDRDRAMPLPIIRDVTNMPPPLPGTHRTNEPKGFEAQQQIHSESSAAASHHIMATEPQIGSYIIYESQPPYESPLDMQYPMHFDNSADLIKCFDEHETVGDISEQLVDAVDQLRKTLGLGFYISVTQAITGAARAQNPLNPALTPIFLAVTVFEGAATRIGDFHEDIVGIVKRHYPRSDFSEHPGLTKPVVRYFMGGGDCAFSDDSDVGDTPQALKETPENIRKHYLGQPFELLSDLSKTLMREEIPCQSNASLLGASVGILGAKGPESPVGGSVGTLGAFCLLKDDKTKDWIRNTNGRPQVFAFTSHHVVWGEEKRLHKFTLEDYKKTIEEKKPLVMAHLGRRDHEATYYTRKRRFEHYREHLKEIDGEPQPGDQIWGHCDAEERARIEGLRWTRQAIQEQMVKDKANAAAVPIYELPIGHVAMSSGRQREKYPSACKGGGDATWPNPKEPVLMDWLLIAIDPKLWKYCINTIPDDFSYPDRYPQNFDNFRAHKTMLSIGQLKKNALVMKAGRSTGITFGKMDPFRHDANVFKGHSKPTHEFCATPVAHGYAFDYHGDSGAAVIDEEGALVGMIMGGQTSNDKTNIRAFVTPIQYIQHDIKTHHGVELYLYTPYLRCIGTAKGGSEVPKDPSANAERLFGLDLSTPSNQPQADIRTPMSTLKVEKKAKQAGKRITSSGSSAFSLPFLPSNLEKKAGRPPISEDTFERPTASELQHSRIQIQNQTLKQKPTMLRRALATMRKKMTAGHDYPDAAITDWTGHDYPDAVVVDWTGDDKPPDAPSHENGVLVRIDRDSAGQPMYLIKDNEKPDEAPIWYPNVALDMSWQGKIAKHIDAVKDAAASSPLKDKGRGKGKGKGKINS